MNLSKFLIFAERSQEKPPLTKERVIIKLGELFYKRMVEKGYTTPSAEEISNAILEREELVNTGVDYGIAFPHAKIDGLDHIGIGIYRVGETKWNPGKNPVQLILSPIVPIDAIGAHINIMHILSDRLKSEPNREKMFNATAPYLNKVNMKEITSFLDTTGF